jgi:hypothetical protein
VADDIARLRNSHFPRRNDRGAEQKSPSVPTEVEPGSMQRAELTLESIGRILKGGNVNARDAPGSIEAQAMTCAIPIPRRKSALSSFCARAGVTDTHAASIMPMLHRTRIVFFIM